MSSRLGLPSLPPPAMIGSQARAVERAQVPCYPALHPWLWQPAAGTPFNPTTYIPLPAQTVTAMVVEFTVPEGRNGVINQMGNNFVGGGFTDGSGDVVWRLLVNGQPYPNFANIIASLGNPAAPSGIGAVRIFEKQLIQLVVKNVGIAVIASQLIGGRLSGWFYPRKLEDPNNFF